nr:glutamate receptor 3.2-like [Tanacetum cinerariifolium]
MRLLLFVGLVYGVLPFVNSRSDIVDIGSIVSPETINGRVSTIAMKAAVDDVNSDPRILQGRQLRLNIHDANYTGFFSIVDALKYMEIPNVAIIGLQSSMMAPVLSYIGNELHVPILSFTDLDPTLWALQYSYFIQTAPNDLYQMTAVAEIVSYFHYAQVTAIYTDDDQFRNGINVLGNELTKKSCRLSGKAPLPVDSKVTREIIKDRLLKVMSMESRVILVHTYIETGMAIFEIAKSLNMMKRGYVWIATAWLSTLLDSVGVLPKSLHGVLTLRPHTINSYKRRAFSRRWKNLTEGRSIGLNSYGLYAYDTVWIIAHAINKYLKESGEISFTTNSSLSNIMGGTSLNLKALTIFDGGKQLRSNILQTNMTGLTGPLRFNEDRSLINPCFDIINVIQTHGRLVGYWSNCSGLSVDLKPSNISSYNQRLRSVVWPGNAKHKPRGWQFPNNVGGFSIDVFNAALKLLQYPLPYEFIAYGDGHKNPSYLDLVNNVASNVFDAAIGDITILTNRTKAVDFTQPYIESGLVVVVHIDKPDSSSWVYVQPFSPQLWCVIALLFLFVGGVVWLLEHKQNDQFRGPPRKQIVTAMWFTFSTMFFAQRENTVSTLGRMVVCIWLFVVLIVNASYTASLTSILTVQQLKSPISGIESLIISKELIGFQVGSYIEDYLVKEVNIPKSRLVALGSPDEYAEKLLSGTVAAIVDERPYMDFFLSKHCDFQIVGKEFTTSGMGFAFPRDSPLAVDMSTAILRLTETGEFKKIHDNWINKEACGPQSSSLVSDQVQLKSFWGLFLIFGLVCVVGVIIHLCMTLYEFRRHHHHAVMNRMQKWYHSTRLQRFFKFVDEKQEATHNKLKRKRRASAVILCLMVQKAAKTDRVGISVVWPGNAKHKPRGWQFPNNGRPLRIGVPLRVTFKEMVMQVNDTKQVGGFSIDVFNAALKLLQYPLPYEFIAYGDGHKNPSYLDLTMNGRVSSIAMKAAVDDVNSDPRILPARQLKLSVHDTNFTALKYMGSATVAIIGPQSSELAGVLSHLGNELHVPILSFTALDPSLSPFQYPYFLQTAPNDLYQMKALAATVSYFRYREVVAIFTDNDQFRNGINVFGNELTKKRCRLSGKAPLPVDRQLTREIIKDRLVKVMSMESRVILVHTYSVAGLSIFEIAKSLGMMKRGYVWIATTWLSAVLDSTGIPPKNADTLHGVLTLRPHTPDSYSKKAFSRRWKKLSNDSAIGINPYGFYAYDTVWIIAHAIDKFLKEGGQISFSNISRLSDIYETGPLILKNLSIFDGGKQMLSNILHTNLTGLTGPLSFNPDRSLRNPSFDVINVLHTKGQLVGYWSNYSGLSVQVPKSSFNVIPSNISSSNQRLGRMIWPGNTKEKPRGWEFSNNGRPLRIGVPLRAGFKEMVMQVNGTKQFSGFCTDVFLAAIKLLPYPLPYEFIMFGNGHNNPSYSDLVNKVSSKVFDAAVGAITIVSNRTNAVDFTQPYIESGLVVVVNIHKAHPSSWAYLQPFSPSLWGVTALFFLFVGAIVWLLEHRHNDEFRGPPKKQVGTVLWFTFSMLFFAHRENTVSTLGRMVVFIWLFVVLIVNSSYTASLTSILTVQQLQTPISGIESLIMGNELIGFPVGSHVEDYLVKELSIPTSRLVPLGSPEEYAEKLLSRAVAAIVDERPYVDLFLSKYCRFQVVGREFTKSGMGFAFPRDSPLAVDLSNAILKLTETGELQKIHDHWLNKKACGPQSLSFVSDQLHLESFWGLFLVFGLVCALALFIHLCRTLHRFRRRHPKVKKPRNRGYRSMRSHKWKEPRDGERMKLIMGHPHSHRLLVTKSSSIVNSKNDIINIGYVVALQSIHGRVSSIALKAAVDDVNSDPIVLPGRRLTISIHDADVTGFYSMFGAMKYLETPTVAVIGPQSSELVKMLSQLANGLHVPILSFTALDPSLSPFQYPYLLQTAPNDLYQMKALAAIVSYFHYREVTAIFTDSDQFCNGIHVFGNELTTKRCRLSGKAPLPVDNKLTREIIKDRLTKVMSMESPSSASRARQRASTEVFATCISANRATFSSDFFTTENTSLDKHSAIKLSLAIRRVGHLSIYLFPSDLGDIQGILCVMHFGPCMIVFEDFMTIVQGRLSLFGTGKAQRVLVANGYLIQVIVQWPWSA